MREPRRTLIKGALAVAALGAFGLPRWAVAGTAAPARPIGLLLGGTEHDAAFLAGAERAAVDCGLPLRAARIVGDAGRLPYAQLRDFVQSQRGVRVLGVLDEASWVLFSASVRDAGGALRLESRHRWFADPASWHDVLTTSAADESAAWRRGERVPGLVAFVVDL